jgi:aminoglycoside phosphotransferase family enzyme
MDLDFHGRADLSRQFVQDYVAASGDPGVLELLDFFKVYRAYVRGKVTAFRLEIPFRQSLPLAGARDELGDPQSPLSQRGVRGDFPPDQRQLLATAQAYFALAYAYTQGSASPTYGVASAVASDGGTPQ